MQTRQVIAAAGAILGALALSAPLAAATFQCDMTHKSGRGGVPDQVMVQFEPGVQTGIVQDAMTRKVDPQNGIPADVTQFGPDKYSLKWALYGVEYVDAGKRLQGAKLRYAMRIDLARMTFTYNGILSNQATAIHGNGTCKRTR